MYSKVVKKFGSVVPQLANDGSNVKDFFVADVIGSKRFAQNYGGYPRSEIAIINEQSNVKLAAQMASDLVDYSPKDNPNAGKTDAEIMLSHRSKYQQTPSESISWLENQLELRRQSIIAKDFKASVDETNQASDDIDKV